MKPAVHPVTAAPSIHSGDRAEAVPASVTSVPCPRSPTVDAALAALAAAFDDTPTTGSAAQPRPASNRQVTSAMTGCARLAAVHARGLPDTATDMPFTRLTRLAVLALGAQLAFVTLLDEHASFRKGRIGTGPPAALGDRQYPAAGALFGQYIVEPGGAMIVTDAAVDLRTRDDPLARSIGARAWAGFPLRGPAGDIFGIFWVVDTASREWTDGNLEVLATFAAAAAAEDALRDEASRADETAEVLQRSMLTDLPDVSHIQLVSRYLPARETAQVGGDWYDAFVLPDGVTALVVGDVAGHDLSAAAQMGQLRNLLRGIACYSNPAPHEVLTGLDSVAFHLQVADLATAVYARIEGTDGGPWQLRWANAGHPPPLLITHDGATRYLDQPAGLLLGLGGGRHTDGIAALPALSTLLLYTDGLVESRRTPIDVGLDRLRVAAGAAAGQPLEQFCDHISAALAGDAADDVTLLALRIPHRDEAGRLSWTPE